MISSNVLWKGNEFIHTRCFTRDITSRKKSESLLSLLNATGNVLASTYDVQDALDAVAKLIVPSFADWLFITMIKDEKVSVIKVEHCEQQNIDRTNNHLRNNEVNLKKFKPNSLAWVLKIGKPVLLEDLKKIDKNITITNNELTAVLGMDATSLIIVPMILKGNVIGALNFISTQYHRLFEEKDLQFAENLATRIAFSIENARLYNETKMAKAEEIKRRDNFQVT